MRSVTYVVHDVVRNIISTGVDTLDLAAFKVLRQSLVDLPSQLLTLDVKRWQSCTDLSWARHVD